MSDTSLDSIFHYITINKIISRIQGPTNKLTRFYGLNPGGANVDSVGGDKFAWDIFDRTRGLATGRFRGSPAGTAKPQKVGHVQATTYRSFEVVNIDYEQLHRNRGIGQPLGSVDARGEKYLSKQIAHLAERFINTREAMVAWMFRGGFQLLKDGDDVFPWPPGNTPTGGFDVDFQHPASNQGNVGGIFGNDWDR